MSKSGHNEDNPPPGHASFAATRWSVVLAAKEGDSPKARAALETLCQTYWFPLYAYLRRSGKSHQDAQDLTQRFFVHLLDPERRRLETVGQEKGRFRNFLKVSIKNFLKSDRDRERAAKRGGSQEIISLESLQEAEPRYAREPADHLTAAQLFDRQWADCLMASAAARLKAEYDADGRGMLFEKLKDSLAGERLEVSHAQIAAALGMTEHAVGNAAHRMRTRFGALVRREVAQSLRDPRMVDEELRALRAALTDPAGA